MYPFGLQTSQNSFQRLHTLAEQQTLEQLRKQALAIIP